MKLAVKRASTEFFDLVFPLSCLECGCEGAWLCTACEQDLPVLLANHCPFCEAKTDFGAVCAACSKQYALDGAVSCIPYAHPTIQALIHAWKYNGVAAITPYLARFAERSLAVSHAAVARRARKSIEHGIAAKDVRALGRSLPLLSGLETVFEPIPLHPKRQKERGFNQAYLLAAGLAGVSPNRALGESLARAKKTSAQAKLGALDRATNMSGAFVITDETRERIRGSHSIVVDDVITTGSTINEAARLLKDAGAISVWALTVAYGHPIRV